MAILAQAEQGNLIAQAELFNDMEERDAHIYAEITKRKMAVAQLDWELKPRLLAGAREKKDIKNLQLLIDDALDVDTLVFDMADGIGHGFSALEIQWQNTGGYWLPEKILHRPQRWFTVDKSTYSELRLRDGTMDGAELIPHGWIIHEHSSKAGKVATRGLYRALALPYLFKNFATKNWLRFCELYAVPIRVLFHHEKDMMKKYALLDAMQSMGQNGVALLEGGTQDDLKTVDAAKGEGQGFLNLIQWCEGSVSKAILGGTLTSDSGKNGNYATASVHDQVRNEIRDHDAKQIAETLTKQLLGAIIAVNGLNIRCEWVFDTQQSADLALYADAIPKMVAVGFKIPTSYIYDKLKIPMPEDGEEVLSLSQAAPMAMSALAGVISQPVFTPDQQAIEDLADGVLNALSSPIDPSVIASAIRAAKDPQDLEARLAAILLGADTSEFNKTLEQALFAADIMGYAHAG
jgi:phage gp29-like protein